MYLENGKDTVLRQNTINYSMFSDDIKYNILNISSHVKMSRQETFQAKYILFKNNSFTSSNLQDLPVKSQVKASRVAKQ